MEPISSPIFIKVDDIRQPKYEMKPLDITKNAPFCRGQSFLKLIQSQMAKNLPYILTAVQDAKNEHVFHYYDGISGRMELDPAIENIFYYTLTDFDPSKDNCFRLKLHKKQKEAVKLLFKACFGEGDGYAQMDLGIFYANFWDIRLMQDAGYWLLRGAENDCFDASILFKFGAYYLKENAPKVREIAVKCLKFAAEAKEPRAQKLLQDIYFQDIAESDFGNVSDEAGSH